MAGKKKKQTGKKLPWWAVLLVLAAVFAVQYLGGKTEEQPAPTAQVQQTPSGETLTVRFLDVGQGDSILLSCGDETMLIDGGPVEEGQFLVSRLNREQRELEPLITAYRALCRAKESLVGAQALLSDAEMRELAQEEMGQAKADIERLEQEIRVLLLPRDPNDGKNVIMEIRAGVGGEESALFASSLTRMYTMYAEKRGWKVEVNSANETELGGVKEISLTVIGDGAWSRLKFESGVHRVQRVPETEAGGRVHTSTATVAVLPEMEQADVALDPADVEMQVFRSSGAGGQHINKTSSAVRLIHKPTGTVVECQQERSQFQNREKAMRMLASILYEREQERIESQYGQQRRSQVGSGMRNERIRTYNFPQGRLTDHRIGLTLYRLDAVMDGDLDKVIDSLVTADQARRLQHAQEG